MLFKFEYLTSDERNGIIANNSDKYLVEEQNILEGNFLIFSDVAPEIENTFAIEEQILSETQYQTALLEMQLLGGM